MSLLSELDALLSPIVQVETGAFTGKAPDRYAVITPMSEVFELYADNVPGTEVQEARISLFDRGSYTAVKNRIVRALLAEDMTITQRRFIGREDDTGYFHYSIDVEKNYNLEE